MSCAKTLSTVVRAILPHRVVASLIIACFAVGESSADEIQHVFTADGEEFLVPTSPEHMFDSKTVAAIAEPDSVFATYWEYLQPGAASRSLPADAHVDMSSRRVVYRSRLLIPELANSIRAILLDPSRYLGGIKLLCSWDGEMKLAFWKDGSVHSITIDNSCAYVRYGKNQWWPVGGERSLSAWMSSVFPESSTLSSRTLQTVDQDRANLLR